MEGAWAGEDLRRRSKEGENKYRRAMIAAGHIRQDECCTLEDSVIIDLVNAMHNLERLYRRCEYTAEKYKIAQTRERNRHRCIYYELIGCWPDGTKTYKPPQTPDEIINEIAEMRGVTLEDLKSISRKRNIAHTRQEIFYELKHHTDLSTSEMGGIFDRDHSTIVHGIKMHKKRMEEAGP